MWLVGGLKVQRPLALSCCILYPAHLLLSILYAPPHTNGHKLEKFSADADKLPLICQFYSRLMCWHVGNYKRKIVCDWVYKVGVGNGWKAVGVAVHRAHINSGNNLIVFTCALFITHRSRRERKIETLFRDCLRKVLFFIVFFLCF